MNMIHHGPTALTHPRFLVIPRPGSKKLVIFFAGTNQPDYQFNFYGQAHKCGESALLVNNGRNEWYQNGVPGLGSDLPETIRTIQAWATALGANQIYCVGASMGGSGAVLYGCMLRAKILAFGFETTLDLPFSQSAKKKPKEHVFPIADLTPIIRASSSPIYAYIGMEDPIDLIASHHIEGLDNVSVTFMRKVGHGPPRYLKKRGRLDQLISAFVNDAEHPAMPEATKLPKGFVNAVKEGFYGFWTRDLDRHETGFAAAARISPKSIVANYFLARALILRGRHEEALPHLEIATNGVYTPAFFYYGYALRHAGRIDEAVEFHRATLEKWPEFGNVRIDLAEALAARGEFNSAILVLQPVAGTEKAAGRIATYTSKARRSLKARLTTIIT